MKTIRFRGLAFLLVLVFILAPLNGVAAPAPLSATPDSPNFGSHAVGYSQRPAQTVTIRNTGTQSVALLALPNVPNWTLTPAANWLTAMNPGQSRTFTIRPNNGLPVGTYNPAFMVFGTGGAHVLIRPTFTVTPVQLATPSAPSLLSATLNSITLREVAQPAGGFLQWRITQINGVNQTEAQRPWQSSRVFTGLTPDTRYRFAARAVTNDWRAVSATSANSAEIRTLAPATWTISVSPDSPNFGSHAFGYAQRPAQTITIRNTGTQSITLLALPNVPNWTLTPAANWLTAMNPGQSRTFTIRPNNGLPVGTYNPAFMVFGTGGANALIRPAFTVTSMQLAVPRIPSLQSATLNSITLADIPQPQGGFIQWRITQINGVNQTEAQRPWQSSRVFTGLTPDTRYRFSARAVSNDWRTISAASANSAEIRTLAHATPAPPATWSISASPDSPSFGSHAFGYSQRAAQTVTIRNTGTQSVALHALPNVPNWTLTPGANWHTAINPGQSRTFTIRPNNGLGVGTHNPVFAVTGTGGASVLIRPSFTVTSVQLATPRVPTRQASTQNSITLADIPQPQGGFIQWRITQINGVNQAEWQQPWQSNRVFTGLAPSTRYRFAARAVSNTAGVASSNASAYSAEITTLAVVVAPTPRPPTATPTPRPPTATPTPRPPTATPTPRPPTPIPTLSTPRTPTLQSATYNTIILADIPQPQGGFIQWRIAQVDGINQSEAQQPWQSGRVFAGLTPNTRFRFVARAMPHDGTRNPSGISAFSAEFVTQPQIASLSASQVAPNFGSHAVGYSPRPAQTITITNTGTQTIELHALPFVEGFTLTPVGVWEGNMAPRGTRRFTIAPIHGLGAGVYSPIIDITGSGGASVQIRPSFIVTERSTNAPRRPTMASRTQDRITLNSITPPAGWVTEYRITHINGVWQTEAEQPWIGTATFTGLDSGTEYIFVARFSGGAHHITSGSSEGVVIRTLESLDFSALQRAVNDANRHHRDDYTVASWNAFSSALTNARNTLNASSPTQAQINSHADALNRAMRNLVLVDNRNIWLSTSGTHNFPTGMAGYGLISPLWVTINNDSTQASGVLSIRLSGANANSFSLSTSSVSSIAGGRSSEFYVVPRTGLSAGTHTATVTVSGSNVSSRSFAVRFVVNPQIIVATPTPVPPPPPPGLPFTDVVNHWAQDAISFVHSRGIMHGVTSTTFNPSGTVDRSMVVTTLHRMAGSPSVTYRPIFGDVLPGQWNSDAIIWAYDNGIASRNVYGLFGATNAVSREELATMLRRYAEIMGHSTYIPLSFDLWSFPDHGQVQGWAREGLRWTVFHGIIGGDDWGHLRPRATVTRAEFAVILQRYIIRFG